MRQPTKNLNPPRPAGTALIILAAGASTRLGQPKQLLPFRGRSLLRHAAETALASVCRPVVVVLGAGAEQLRSELTALPVTVTLNPAWAEGMASSIRAGLGTVTSEAHEPDSVVIMLCDQPALTAKHLSSLLTVWREQPHRAVGSAYANIVGVPAVLPRSWFEHILTVQGDRGARARLREDPEVIWIDAPELAQDIDTAQDFPG